MHVFNKMVGGGLGNKVLLEQELKEMIEGAILVNI